MTVTDATAHAIPDAPAALEGAERPVYRFPPEAYWSPQWYEHEQRELFAKTWIMVGHVDDMAEPGDFLAVTVGNEPVVVVRDSEGALAAYLNICRHRGMTIVASSEDDHSGNCGNSLRCPYHGWEWDLAGDLKRVPQRKTQFPDLDEREFGLFGVAVGTWRGFIFVHTDPTNATPFDEWLADFDDASGVYPWETLTEVYRKRWDLNCNWKLYIENHIDWLHLWYLHEESLGMYDHHKGVRRDCGLHWASYEMIRAGQERSAADGLELIPGVSEEESSTLRANLVFPNVPFVTTGRSLQSYQIIPTGPETCTIDLRIFGQPGGQLSPDGVMGAELVLYTEDGGVCEQMQAAMRSPHFAVGPLAMELERPIGDLHERLMSFVGEFGVGSTPVTIAGAGSLTPESLTAESLTPGGVS